MPGASSFRRLQLLLPLPLLRHLGRAARVDDLDKGADALALEGWSTEQSSDIDCCFIKPISEDIREWLEMAKDLDDCCENHGPVFGWHGAKNCPAKIGDVLASSKKRAKQADAGKSGAKVIVTPEYVVKVINHEEAIQQSNLMYRLQMKQSDDALSFMVPTCRDVQVFTGTNPEPQHMIVMPNVMLQGVQGSHTTFDLKGNWDYGKRFAEWDESTMKDMNFHAMFPRGMTVVGASFKGEHIQDDGRAFLTGLLRDTYNLERLELMDYSLLVDMVDLCPQEVTVRSKRALVVYSEGRLLKLSAFKKQKSLAAGAPHARPIYKNADGEYMYYWAAAGKWLIGFDPQQYIWGLAAQSQAGCPDEASNWQVYHSNGWWDEGQAQVKSVDTISTPDLVQQGNADKPLLWLQANGVRFAMSVGIIDMFMHSQDRGFWNTLGATITFAACRPHDVDPIPAEEYRVRFMRMVGYKDPLVRDGQYCGSCLGSRRRESYTYLATQYQKEQYSRTNCSWGSY